MLNMHPDIVCTMKGVMSNNGHKGAIDLNQIITWKLATEGMSPPLFVDSTCKCIDGNGELLDSDGIIGADVNPPQYSEVVEDRSAPSVGLTLTNPLFLSPSKYLRIDFD